MPELELYAGSTLRVLCQACDQCAEHPDQHGRQTTSALLPVTEQHGKCVLMPYQGQSSSETRQGKNV